MMQTKHCPKCNTTKTIDKFHVCPSRPDGLNSHCIECKFELNATERMFINGKYISKKHPLWKAGRYKTLDDAWSHTEIDARSDAGEVYVVHNPAWPDWYKVGKAVSSEDRLNNYQTSSPFRDYVVQYSVEFDNRHQAESAIHRLLEKHKQCTDRSSEWFKTNLDTIKEVIDDYRTKEACIGHRNEQPTQYDLVSSNAGC